MDVPIDYVAVVVAAISNMVLGFLWYGPIFGKPWKTLMGFTDETMKTMSMSPLQASIGGLIGALVMAFVLAHSLVFASSYLNVSGASAGIMAGFWSWLGFIAPVTLGVVLWEGRPWRLWLINTGYYFIALPVMGLILAIFP